ncbi:2-amino-3,7-dideoxy-D-threo-hept-6-ulosonate synthase [Micromonospora sp. CA-263727]|uniref:2-amino-3,7-dideoxy-D-threo-hept-6-ulosonate synthase n=1 Tax=Micromonospora sp. CA-263727 TaxID=3239967 RepID=UPI003D8F0D26
MSGPGGAILLRPYGKALRLARLTGRHKGRALFVPLDHSVTSGQIACGRPYAGLVRDLVDAGVDAVIVHKGRIRSIEPATFVGAGLIVHLSAGTVHHADPNSKVLVGSVEEAARWGADAVSVHVNVGSPTEPAQLRDLGLVAGECDRLGLPLLAMMYARGDSVSADPFSPRTLIHLACIAADLGADLVKLPYPGTVEAMREVVAASALPVYVAGGDPSGGIEETVELTRHILGAGAAGLSFGRCIFDAADPAAIASAVAAVANGFDPEPLT